MGIPDVLCLSEEENPFWQSSCTTRRSMRHFLGIKKNPECSFTIWSSIFSPSHTGNSCQEDCGWEEMESGLGKSFDFPIYF